MINETLAKRSKENMSFSDYKEGSATAEYNAVIAEVKEQIDEAKTRVSPEAQERLDRLFDWYKGAYAKWVNKHNANGANHVSQMISGASNYNMRKHEKYLSREGKLWEEYDELQNIGYKIQAIVNGDKIIKSSDVDAIEKLQAKLAQLQKYQETMKAANAILRKKKLTDAEKIEQLTQIGFSESSARELLQPDFCGRVGFTYHLQNNNGNMRTIKQRIEKLQRQKAEEATEIIIEADNEDGAIRIVDNPQADRLQIFFPSKPSAEIRTQLKRNGFRWTPSIGAWQSYRNSRAKQVAKEIAGSV